MTSRSLRLNPLSPTLSTDESMDEVLLTDFDGTTNSDLEKSVKQKLATWCVQHNISNEATDELLSILRQHINGLPTDAKTLKSTLKTIVKVPMGAGEYEHCDVEGVLTYLTKNEMDINSTSYITPEATSITKQDLIDMQIKIRTEIFNMEKRLLNAINEKHKATKSTLMRLVADVSGVRQTTLKENKNPSWLTTPFKDLTSFMEFERSMQDDNTKFNDLVTHFNEQIATNANKFLIVCWRSVLYDDVSQNLCWKGTHEKDAVRALTTTAAMKSAYSKKFPAATDAEFERTCIKFFQQAKNRLLKKQNYQKKNKCVEDKIN